VEAHVSAIEDVVHAVGRDWVTTDDVARMTGRGLDATRRALTAARTSGIIEHRSLSADGPASGLYQWRRALAQLPRVMATEAKPAPMSPVRARCLAALSALGPLTTPELERLSGCTRVGTRREVTKMERDGLIQAVGDGSWQALVSGPTSQPAVLRQMPAREVAAALRRCEGREPTQRDEIVQRAVAAGLAVLAPELVLTELGYALAHGRTWAQVERMRADLKLEL
jgi:hypothetical protein